MICFTPAEVATRWKCSANLVRKMIDNGELPAFRAGGKLLRIRLDDLEAYEAHQSTTAEIVDDGEAKRSAAGKPPETVLGLDRAIALSRKGRR